MNCVYAKPLTGRLKYNLTVCKDDGYLCMPVAALKEHFHTRMRSNRRCAVSELTQ